MRNNKSSRCRNDCRRSDFLGNRVTNIRELKGIFRESSLRMRWTRIGATTVSVPSKNQGFRNCIAGVHILRRTYPTSHRLTPGGQVRIQGIVKRTRGVQQQIVNAQGATLFLDHFDVHVELSQIVSPRLFRNH